MATVTHYIRSEYDPEIDKDRLLRETGQIDDHLWQAESSSAAFYKSNRITHAPVFVPARLPYDQWASPTTPTEPTSTDGPGDVATWYRSLNRQVAHSTQQQPPSSESSSLCGSPPPHTPASTTHAAAPTPPPPSLRPLRVAPNPQHRGRDRGRRDWFISRATASAPPPTKTFPPSNSGDSLADILSRNPPAATQPLRPPVFLHLGPSNKGWTMLQNQGWTEGEGLGAAAAAGPSASSKRRRRQIDDACARSGTTWQTWQNEEGGGGGSISEERGQLGPKASISSSPSPPSQMPRTVEEATIDDDYDDDDNDDIVEVLRKAPVPLIDLTQSDTEDQEGEREEEQRLDSEEPDDPVPERPPDDAPATPIDPRAAQTALLTPLPTVLKSDRLGIGLKAKTEGPYRSSVKRVTHNAAALAAHARAAEDVRRSQQRFGKGRRAFTRIERLERESRQNIMSYLSEP